MGAIATPQGILGIVTAAARRYDAGELTAIQMQALLQRMTAQLDRACWCGEKVCCTLHGRHVSPHQHCILR